MIITLAGVIGVGKSSMTEILANLLDTKAVYEPVEENPMLELFYQDKSKYGLLFQIDMLSKRFEMIQEAMSVDNGILDRSIFEDSIFLDQLVQEGHVNEMEQGVYHRLLERMLKELEPLPKKTPDLMVVLNCSFEEEIRRINARAREFEKVEEGTELYEYFKRHHENYQNWMEKDLGFPKIILDVTEIDFVNNPEHRQQIVSQIIDKLFELGCISEGQAVNAYKELYQEESNQQAVMKFYNHAKSSGIDVPYHVVAHFWDIERKDI
ncbi:deoxynucleoside kinase [Enterococcus phage vB_EfaM_A2]|uniref:Deoxynucleoside kinase n=1 Tax=Enterococcus phage vB_EfaM_A2 TaxID=2767513 RepID=A0A7G9A3G0_9CAUD|nr:deoxynucleoside kinase [Enterococcus phage vB_EfaM_A2]